MGSEDKILMVLANKDFQDIEYHETYEALKGAGIDVAIAATLNEECKGVSGTEVSVDYSLSDVEIAEFKAMVLIGGTGVEGYLHEVIIHDLAKNMLSEGKLVAAICWAPAILANAGVLNGKRATSWSGAAKDLTAGGAIYTGEPVVIDGNIITANGPDSAPAFGKAIVEALAG